MSLHELDIERLANGGDGVAHLEDGRVAFIPLAVPGDRIEAEVTEDRDSYVRMQLKNVLTPSVDRVTPPCPYFGRCGGCQWQHISREVQLAAKAENVRDSLERIGHLNTKELVGACEAPSAEYGYRNKVELRVDTSGHKLELGFTLHESDEIVPIDECLLMPKRHRKLIASVRGALRFIVGREDVTIDRVGLRMAENARDLQVALWTPPSGFPRALAGKTLEQATGATSVVRVISSGASSKRAVKNVERLAGKAWWSERLSGMRLSASAPSFFQVNTSAAERLVEIVAETADVQETDMVLDLYSGAGTFTIPLAEQGTVVAVESSRWALADLKHNLERAQVHAEVMGGDAAYALDDIYGCDVAVVDPPRAGLAEEVVSDLVAQGPRRLVYVSCDHATLARDAARFAHAGYTLDSVTPVDLFPNTYHVEMVAAFSPAEL